MNYLASNAPTAYVVVLQESNCAESKSLFRFVEGENVGFAASPKLAAVLDATDRFLSLTHLPPLQSLSRFSATVTVGKIKRGLPLPIDFNDGDGEDL